MRYLATISVTLLFSTAVTAQNLDSIYRSSQEGNEAAQASQQRIDAVVDQTRDLASDYSAVMKEVDGLLVYNRLMERQIEGQMQELAQLDESMDQVSVIERQVVPLMIRMIEGLEQFIALDVPFLEDERSNRIASLREMMERSDVTAAEKFRRVLESYQIENEYGRTIEAYKGTLNIDGVDRDVDFLRIGRVGLYYQTLDSQYSGMWDRDTSNYIPLGDEYRGQIREGLRIARKQTAPNLLNLPVPAAEG